MNDAKNRISVIFYRPEWEEEDVEKNKKSKGKVLEIMRQNPSVTRHFYLYEPPRALDEIESYIKELESDIVRLLGEVTR